MARLCEEHYYRKKAALVGQNGRLSASCNFICFWLLKTSGKVKGFKLPNLYCLDSFSSLVWSRNSVLPSPLVSWSLKTSHFMAPIGIEAWLHTEAENSINLIQYCHHIPNWLEIGETISSLSLCYFYLEKFAVYRYLNSFGYPVSKALSFYPINKDIYV